jgi:hypothetical protein
MTDLGRSRDTEGFLSVHAEAVPEEELKNIPKTLPEKFESDDQMLAVASALVAARIRRSNMQNRVFPRNKLSAPLILTINEFDTLFSGLTDSSTKASSTKFLKGLTDNEIPVLLPQGGRNSEGRRQTVEGRVVAMTFGSPGSQTNCAFRQNNSINCGENLHRNFTRSRCTADW